MGSRADFYVGRGPEARWLASVAWDGYPSGIVPRRGKWPRRRHLFDARTEGEYLARLETYLAGRTDVSRPADGWPWPWPDGGTTDAAYAFEAGRVWLACFGRGWYDPRYDFRAEEENGDDPMPAVVFPDMRDVRRATLGPRSGLIIIEWRGDPP